MLQYIQSFITVYQVRSFTKAADQLFISQPSVSSHIKHLEAALGVDLFTRGKKSEVQRTAAADLFYPQAQKILTDWQQAQKFFSTRDNATEKVALKIGASHFSALTLVPHLIPALTQLPVQLTVEMRNSQDLMQQIAQGTVDFAFVEQPVMDPSLSVVPLMTDQLVLAGSGDTWLLREVGASTRAHMDRYFAQHGLPDNTLTITSTDVILALLQTGFGKAIISKKLIANHIPYVPLDESFQRPVNLIYRAPLDASKTSVLETITQTLTTNFEIQ
ncbi:LysR family transcriptional regulator [Leuconostoc lactis]|uniref:LysR family transcriptional regulator n=1 Tax=Leuconostoc lactis TaxID=1246 RepID=UPI0028A07D28|nr:LysR family transcriptional regulator [Leuconostoc lactis]